MELPDQRWGMRRKSIGCRSAGARRNEVGGRRPAGLRAMRSCVLRSGCDAGSVTSGACPRRALIDGLKENPRVTTSPRTALVLVDRTTLSRSASRSVESVRAVAQSRGCPMPLKYDSVRRFARKLRHAREPIFRPALRHAT